MKFIHTTLLSFLFFILPFFSISQEYSYTNYSDKEGLVGTTVYCIQQDKEGFLWFGTETGLSRFDGTHFKNFTTTDGLPDNEILKLFVDSKNRVWIIPFRNSVCYYWKGKIYNRENDSILAKINISSTVKAILEDRYGNILIQEETASNIIKPNGEIDIIKEVNHDWFLFAEAGMNEKGGFRMILGIRKSGGTFFDLDNGKMEIAECNSRFHLAEGPYSFLFSPTLEVMKKPDSLIIYRIKQKELFYVPLPDNFISMAELNDSLFVINATAKCMVYNLNQKRITGEFLNGHSVTTVLEDTEKNLWFATMGEGIFRLASPEFRNIRFSDGKSSLSAFSIYKSGSSVFIGTNHSLLWNVDLHTGIRQKYTIRTSNTHARVLSLTPGNNKALIIGTDWGIYKLGEITKKIMFPATIKTMVFSNNKMFVATATCAFSMEERAGGIDTVLLWDKRSTCIFPNDSGFYIGTLNGLYEGNKNKQITFLGKENKILRSRISMIARSTNGIFWIATYGEGIIGYKDGRVMMHLTSDNGLTSNICRNIFISGSDLWIGTDKGLNKVTVQEDQFKITKFTTADGLSSDIINAVYVDSGMVYAGTPEGVTYFDENKVSQSSDCFLRITAINNSDRTWNYDSTGFLFPHRDNNIQFEFVGVSYKSAGNITYRYRLMGLDSNWKTTRETFLSYPSLPSGKYELQLVAINKFLVDSDLKRISFEVEELLGEKKWFRILLFFMAGGLAWIIVSLYIRGIRRKEAAKANTLRRMAELEQMALKAQMNPHFIFNSLNSIQQYVIEKDTAGANKFITGFSSLIRQTLDFSSKQEISLEEDLQYLATYLELEKTRMENKFDYEIRIGDTLQTNKYHIPPMILQPYVENSIRHGIGYRKDKLGRILISVTQQADRLVCMIEDNGVGRLVAGQFKRNEPADRQSKGMSVTAARIEMFSKNSKHKIKLAVHDKKDDHDNVLGTCVIISFPV